MPSLMRSVGLDFGTTNSAIGVASPEGVRLAKYSYSAGLTETFRSVLYFSQDARDNVGRYIPTCGPRAIDRYLEAEPKGRLIQSLKSYVADRSFQATSIFGRTHSLVDLLVLLLTDLRARAEEDLGDLGSRIVVGRPVHFAYADDEALAIERMKEALGKVGFTDVAFELEPVAAANFYEERLEKDERVLVADFGGGTSDFSILDVGPSFRGKPRTVIGNDGVGLAGDALDAKVVQNLVAPRLGMGSTYRAMFGRELEVPVWLYAKLRRWHHLSFLKTKKNMDLIAEIESQSDAPEQIELLIRLLENDLGYQLFRAVERAKVALSSAESTRFQFEELGIEADLTRAQFEGFVSEETMAMSECVDRLLADTGTKPTEIDQVFMTGGTSFVPAVRRIFDDRFGAAKIRAGGEMISVATGLTLRAAL